MLWELTAFLSKRTGLFSLIIFHTHPSPGMTSKPLDIFFKCHSLCCYFSCSSSSQSLSGLKSTPFQQTYFRLWHPFCPLLRSVFSGTLENKSQWQKGDAFSTITGPSNWSGSQTFTCLLLCRNTSVWQTPLGKDASRGPLGSWKTWQIIPQDKLQATFFPWWSLEILEISTCCRKVLWG